MVQRWFSLGLLLSGGALVACGNPAVDVRIAELPEEDPNVPVGEFHRPGQPCVLCHSSYGGDAPVMSIAGTIYAVKGLVPNPEPAEGEPTRIAPPPVGDVSVLMYDAFGRRSPPVATNCVGNFYLTKEQWDPVFPVYAEIEFTPPEGTQSLRAAMATWIQREGSCNTCHNGDANQGSVGRIYCMEKMPDPPFDPPTKANCNGVP
ncbi:hypothetical protein [Chondromyces crocatus]|nr:hypothetical protein [Chondromyces crocatus]